MGSYTFPLLVCTCPLGEKGVSFSSFLLATYSCLLKDWEKSLWEAARSTSVRCTILPACWDRTFCYGHCPTHHCSFVCRGALQLDQGDTSFSRGWTCLGNDLRKYVPAQQDVCCPCISWSKNCHMWLNRGWLSSSQAEDRGSGMWNPCPFSILDFLFFPTSSRTSPSSPWAVSYPTFPLFIPFMGYIVHKIKFPQIPPNHEGLYVNIILLNKTVHNI